MSEENKNLNEGTELSDKESNAVQDSPCTAASAEGGEAAVIKPTKSFGKWFENVWYHYKWHILGALFVIAVVIICIVQCSGKTESDISIGYAGTKEILSFEKDGRIEREDLMNGLTDVIDDYNDDGEKSVSLQTYLWYSSKEIEELAKEEDDTGRIAQIEQASKNNLTQIDSLVTYSDYYVWFISPALFDNYCKDGKIDLRFAELDTFVKSGKTVEYYEKAGETYTNAIYLRSTGLAGEAGMDIFPEDTLIVLRPKPYNLNKSDSEYYTKCLEFVKKIINM